MPPGWDLIGTNTRLPYPVTILSLLPRDLPMSLSLTNVLPLVVRCFLHSTFFGFLVAPSLQLLE